MKSEDEDINRSLLAASRRLHMRVWSRQLISSRSHTSPTRLRAASSLLIWLALAGCAVLTVVVVVVYLA